MKIKTIKLVGNCRFHYLTGKHKMFDVAVSVIDFLQKFVQTANFSTEILLSSAYHCCLYFYEKFYYNMIYFSKHDG